MKELQINGKTFKINQSVEIAEEYKLGDTVRILVKDYSEFVAYSGIIVAIDDFAKSPSVTVCYFTNGYNPEVKFKTISGNEKDSEISKGGDFDDSLSFDTVISIFENKVLTKKGELESLVKQFENVRRALVRIQGDTIKHKEN